MAKLKGLTKGAKSLQSEINITPLIDIVLVLLIIFMVITPILIREMAINLPDKTETIEQEDLPEQQLLAAVCKDGSFALNTEVMPLDKLKEQVRKHLRGRANKVVFVDGYPDAPYDTMVKLMDAVRDAGAEKLGLATLKTERDFMACTPTAPPPAAAPSTGQ